VKWELEGTCVVCCYGTKMTPLARNVTELQRHVIVAPGWCEKRAEIVWTSIFYDARG